MGLRETEAIVLRTYNLAEADKIVVCLTLDSGVVRAVARGARKLKSRFGAGLEPSTVLVLSYFEKEGRELVSLRHAEIVCSYFRLASSMEIVSALAYMSELVMEFSPPGEPNEKVYRMVKAVLDALDREPGDLQALILYFEIWILKLSGFFPDLRACARCGKSLGNGRFGFFTSQSGLSCEECSLRAAVELSHAACDQLRSAKFLSPLAFAEKARSLKLTQRVEMAELTKTFIGRALEKRPQLLVNIK